MNLALKWSKVTEAELKAKFAKQKYQGLKNSLLSVAMLKGQDSDILASEWLKGEVRRETGGKVEPEKEKALSSQLESVFHSNFPNNGKEVTQQSEHRIRDILYFNIPKLIKKKDSDSDEEERTLLHQEVVAVPPVHPPIQSSKLTLTEPVSKAKWTSLRVLPEQKVEVVHSPVIESFISSSSSSSSSIPETVQWDDSSSQPPPLSRPPSPPRLVFPALPVIEHVPAFRYLAELKKKKKTEEEEKNKQKEMVHKNNNNNIKISKAWMRLLLLSDR